MTIFFSYAWERDLEGKGAGNVGEIMLAERSRNFAAILGAGIMYDIYNKMPQHISHEEQDKMADDWMEKEVKSADFVIVAVTRQLIYKLENPNKDGRNSKVFIEKDLIEDNQPPENVIFISFADKVSEEEVRRVYPKTFRSFTMDCNNEDDDAHAEKLKHMIGGGNYRAMRR